MDVLQAASVQGTSRSGTIYLVAGQVAKGDLRVVWFPTDQMISDLLTKPLQGKAFVKFRDMLMGEE